MNFDLKKWANKFIEFDTVNDINLERVCFEEKFILIIKNEGLPLHILLDGFKSNKNFLVGFSGALSSRNEKILPPFFSFLNIAKENGSPYMLVSDPSLYLSKDLKLAWYAGNERYLNLQKDIAIIINKLSIHFNSSPVLAGGSGGGFASLAVSSYINVTHSIFVWNPQTNIENYYKRFVEDYIKSAFPEHKGLELKKALNSIQLKKVLTDISSVSINSRAKLLYVQNYSDWHRETHTKPFLESQGFIKNMNNNLSKKYFINSQSMVLLANWGEGHKVPPKQIIQFALHKMINNIEVASIIDDIFELFPDCFDSIYEKT